MKLLLFYMGKLHSLELLCNTIYACYIYVHYYVTQYQCNVSVTTKEFREFFLYSTIIVYVDVAHACNKRQFLSYFNKLTVETCETTSLPNKYPAPRGLTPQPWLSEIKK